MQKKTKKEARVLVTGGAGYVGAVLVPYLLKKGHKVNVLDTFWFWDSPDEFLKVIKAKDNPNLTIISGDLRNKQDIIKALKGVDSVIHLACISNDPSADLDPKFTHSVNYDGSINMIDLAKEKGVKIRPSTVSGYSPRMRFDLVVNILASSAISKGKIKVFGGEQLRPLIHIKDMARLYELLLRVPIDKIHRKIFNAGYGNLKVVEIANLIKEVVGDIPVEVVPTDDMRSYHVCSDKIKNELGFVPEHTIKESVEEIKKVLEGKKIKDVDDDAYHNIKRMKKILGVGKVPG